MGADAHVAVEYKRFDKMWDCWALRLPTSRDYILFGLLAGVRNKTSESYTPRGIPTDASPEVRKWLEDSDFHSHSWMTPFEFYNVCLLYEQSLKRDGYDEYTLSRDWQALAEIMLVLTRHYGSRNIRIVFAFDS